MKTALYGRFIKDDDLQHLQQLLALLCNSPDSLLVYEPYRKLIQEKGLELSGELRTFTDKDDLSGRVDHMVSVGGDGSILSTIKAVKESEIPVLGINMGRLGFLASAGRKDFEQAVQNLNAGRYLIDRRQILQLNSDSDLFDDLNYALNEFSLHKHDSGSMVTVHVWVDGVFLNSYWADGVIVSTPTGSTAYNLSCGGPIVYPGSRAVVITPIAPHNLNVRPIVLPSDVEIKLKIAGRSEYYICNLDGRSSQVDAEEELSIVTAPFTFNLIRFEEGHFFSTIRGKLLWGSDTRN